MKPHPKHLGSIPTTTEHPRGAWRRLPELDALAKAVQGTEPLPSGSFQLSLPQDMEYILDLEQQRAEVDNYYGPIANDDGPLDPDDV
jgi:hypothetical protein